MGKSYCMRFFFCRVYIYLPHEKADFRYNVLSHVVSLLVTQFVFITQCSEMPFLGSSWHKVGKELAKFDS